MKTRSTKLERIDTGDYTDAEYERFLTEIAFINRYIGDARALRKSLYREIDSVKSDDTSILDVGCGSGELLRQIEKQYSSSSIAVQLVGIDLNPISTRIARESSAASHSITILRADAFRLPFEDGAFDHAICSLFLHHLTDSQIPLVLSEMSRVSRRGVYAIDLHRKRASYVLYKVFCSIFRISPLVRQDGSLSILRGFVPAELAEFGDVRRVFPYRLVMHITKDRL